jgi:hypothetical protein
MSMLLQTNSYIVPREKAEEHARLMRRFKQALHKLGCDQFEVYEQTAPGWAPGESGRCVQLMRFRDRKHQQQVQGAERTDPVAQAIIAEFCELLNIPYQQQQGFFAAGFYQAVVSERDSTEGPVVHHPARGESEKKGESETRGESEKQDTEPKIDGSAPQPGMF